VTLKTGRGQHRKYLPYVFTEQGVAMLSSVLRSRRAVQVNIKIMRAFVRLRRMLAPMKNSPASLLRLKGNTTLSFFDAIRELMRPPEPKKRRMGFLVEEKAGRYGSNA
jgi:hypothetical protein